MNINLNLGYQETLIKYTKTFIRFAWYILVIFLLVSITQFKKKLFTCHLTANEADLRSVLHLADFN